MIYTIEFLKNLLLFGSVAGADGTDPLLLACKVMLYVNNLNPTSKTVAADLVEPTWATYARSSTITWGTPLISNQTQLPVIAGDAKSFVITTNTPEETAYGYALVQTISAVDHLLAVRPFATPIQPGAGTEILIVPRVGLSEEAVNPDGDVTLT